VEVLCGDGVWIRDQWLYHLKDGTKETMSVWPPKKMPGVKSQRVEVPNTARIELLKNSIAVVTAVAAAVGLDATPIPRDPVTMDTVLPNGNYMYAIRVEGCDDVYKLGHIVINAAKKNQAGELRNTVWQVRYARGPPALPEHLKDKWVRENLRLVALYAGPTLKDEREIQCEVNVFAKDAGMTLYPHTECHDLKTLVRAQRLMAKVGTDVTMGPPIDAAESAKPSQPLQPIDAAESAEPSQPLQPIDAAEPAKPSQPMQPIEPAQPTESANAADQASALAPDLDAAVAAQAQDWLFLCGFNVHCNVHYNVHHNVHYRAFHDPLCSVSAFTIGFMTPLQRFCVHYSFVCACAAIWRSL
jgi:hypothetical protein